jgi:hypothetical protein
MGEFPQKCPAFCSVPGAAAAMGCEGPTEHPIHTIRAASGKTMAIHECPHRILRRSPDVAAAVAWFFGFVETGVLPNAGGWFDQAVGFDDVRAVCGAERGSILEDRAARERARRG